MPREVHEHFDANGHLTGTTVITRESAWDETQRAVALALHDYDNSLCGCGCGQPITETYSGKQAYKVDTLTCSAGRALDRVRRMKREAAERDNRPAGWDDGLHYYAIPIDADEKKKPKGG